MIWGIIPRAVGANGTSEGGISRLSVWCDIVMMLQGYGLNDGLLGTGGLLLQVPRFWGASALSRASSSLWLELWSRNIKPLCLRAHCLVSNFHGAGLDCGVLNFHAR